jgi:polyisoprenoid-binding protein YceI
MKNIFMYLSYLIALFSLTLFASDSYKVDPASTQITWYASKVTGFHYGEVKLDNGVLNVENSQLKGGNFAVDLSSITVSKKDLEDEKTNQKLVGHLKSEDFFAVGVDKSKNLATFEIKSVTEFGKLSKKQKEKITEELNASNGRPNTTTKVENPTHLVKGNLTIKGKSLEQELPVVISTQKNQINAKGLMVIDRTRWDIRYGSGKFFQSLGDKVIHDNFEVAVDLKAKK